MDSGNHLRGNVLLLGDVMRKVELEELLGDRIFCTFPIPASPLHNALNQRVFFDILFPTATTTQVRARMPMAIATQLTKTRPQLPASGWFGSRKG